MEWERIPLNEPVLTPTPINSRQLGMHHGNWNVLTGSNVDDGKPDIRPSAVSSMARTSYFLELRSSVCMESCPYCLRTMLDDLLSLQASKYAPSGDVQSASSHVFNKHIFPDTGFFSNKV